MAEARLLACRVGAVTGVEGWAEFPFVCGKIDHSTLSR
jgi:hypothetical protein